MFNRLQLPTTFRNLKLSVVLLALASFASTASYATITNATANSYSAGLSCYPDFYAANDTLEMDLTQSGPGQINGMIYTDSAADPTLTLVHNINNASGIGWNAYHVTVFMPNFFSLANAMVNTPGGWSASIVNPTMVIGGYQGQINYSGGPVIAPGGTLNFQFDLTFADGLAYSFTETAAPGLVPEPSTICLGLLGLVAFAARRSRKTA